MSFREPAAELREVLPEVCDHLAPNADVMNSPGYKPEKDERGKDRTPLTMKQQVRLIQKARAKARAPQNYRSERWKRLAHWSTSPDYLLHRRKQFTFGR
jgi:hypothetical protein